MDDVSCLVAPAILPFVQEILRDGKVGICAGYLRVIDIQTGLNTLEKVPCGDRFKLVIPYAGQSVTWEVVFFGNSPCFPPDFLFDDKTFLPSIEDIRSLTEWNSDDPKMLLQVITDLISAYRKHQLVLVESYSRLLFEYTSLVEQGEFSERDIEILVKNGNVDFLIRLPIDFSKIPPVLTKFNPGEDSAVLLITFHSPDSGRIVPNLFLSPRVQKALGELSNLLIPTFPRGGYLLQYVPHVCRILQQKVNQIVSDFEKRKDLVAAFLNRFGRAVLEYDTESLTKMALLFEWKDFFFILHIELPKGFPADKPILTFQSIYHTVNGKPYSCVCQDYPYSPRWSGNELAERLSAFVLDYITVFQKNSIRSLK